MALSPALQQSCWRVRLDCGFDWCRRFGSPTQPLYLLNNRSGCFGLGIERSKPGKPRLYTTALPQLTHRNPIQEDARSTFYFAHLFFADHVLSTSWTVFFAVVWWLYSPHDGRRVSTSAAQDNIIENYLGETEKVSEEERTRLALQLWRREKGVAIAIIILGWLIKVRD